MGGLKKKTTHVFHELNESRVEILADFVIKYLTSVFDRLDLRLR